MAGLVFLVFPDALFPVPLLADSLARLGHHGHWDVLVVEEPSFYHDRKHRPFRMHRVRCAHSMAALAAYVDELRARLRGGHHVKYVPYDVADAALGSLAGTRAEVCCWRLTDLTLRAKLAGLLGRVREIESPMFVLTEAQAGELPAGRGFTAFYRALRRNPAVDGVLPPGHYLRIEPSHDPDNRRAWPRSPVPPPYAPPPGTRARDSAAREACVARACALFPAPAHAGPPDSAAVQALVARLPVTRRAALARLRAFVKERLSGFGPYQDAVHDGEDELCHSNLAFLLNCGLLQPHDVLKAVARDKAAPNGSAEALVRQVLGWREYMRAVYVQHGPALRAHFGLDLQSLHRPSPPWRGTPQGRAWYSAATGHPALDAEIRKALGSAYAHHTVRLMVFLNLLVLGGVPPAGMLAWFMEVVSLDAYEWVMLSNLAAMGYMQAALPGRPRFMRKPYWSSSAYLVRMSGGRYGRDARWDALFCAHLRRRLGPARDPGPDRSDAGARLYLRNLPSCPAKT